MVSHSCKDLHFPLQAVLLALFANLRPVFLGDQKEWATQNMFPWKTDFCRHTSLELGLTEETWTCSTHFQLVCLTFTHFLQKQPAHPWKLKRFSWLHIFEVWNCLNLVAFMGSVPQKIGTPTLFQSIGAWHCSKKASLSKTNGYRWVVLPSWQVYMDSKRKHDIVGYGKIGHCKHFRRRECIARQDMVRQGKVL